MRRIDKLTKTQRLVVVVAVGVGFLAVGNWLLSLRSQHYGFSVVSGGGGEFAAGGGFAAPHALLSGWIRLVVWLVLTLLWAVVSIRLLRPSGRDESD